MNPGKLSTSFSIKMSEEYFPTGFQKGDKIQIGGYKGTLTVLEVKDTNEIEVGYPTIWWRIKYYVSIKWSKLQIAISWIKEKLKRN
jgi:hypothetical protein